MAIVFDADGAPLGGAGVGGGGKRGGGAGGGATWYCRPQ